RRMPRTRRSSPTRGPAGSIAPRGSDVGTPLAATKLVLDVLARGIDPAQCAHEIAAALVGALDLEGCAIVLSGDGAPHVIGCAGSSLTEEEWLTLAAPARVGEAVALRRKAGGHVLLLPFATGGVLLLHAGAAEAFARPAALLGLAGVVGQALAVARLRVAEQGELTLARRRVAEYESALQ